MLVAASTWTIKPGVSSRAALRRMLEKKCFRLLRAVTGELIPDDGEAWRNFLGEK